MTPTRYDSYDERLTNKHRCSICGILGHNRRSHILHIPVSKTQSHVSIYQAPHDVWRYRLEQEERRKERRKEILQKAREYKKKVRSRSIWIK